MELTTIFLGFATGVLIGLGGGALMGPALILGLGVPAVVAGVDLVYSAVTKLVGTIAQWRRGTIDLGLTGTLLLGSLPGSVAGIALLSFFRSQGLDPNLVAKKTLGGVLVLASLVIVVRLLLAGREMGWQLSRRSMVVVGFTIGVLVAMSSVGSGTLLVAALALGTAMPSARIVGTDIFHAAILTTVAGLLHLWQGNVDLGLTATILVGSIPGVVVGSRLSYLSPEWVLRPVLAIVLMVAAVRLML